MSAMARDIHALLAERDELRAEVERLQKRAERAETERHVLSDLYANAVQLKAQGITIRHVLEADEAARCAMAETDRLRAQWDALTSDAVVDAAGWEETMEHGRIGTVAAERVIRAAMDAAREGAESTTEESQDAG